METVRHEQDAIEWWSSWDEPGPATADEEREFARTRQRLRRIWAKLGPSAAARRPARRCPRVRRAAIRRRRSGLDPPDPEPHPAAAVREAVVA